MGADSGILRYMSSIDQIASIVVAALCFVPAIVFHEVAHGLMAHALGDDTAKRAGRLTLNPAKHIDPFGTVLLPLLMAMMQGPVFGYAKPVPYNPANLKNPRVGDVLVGIAGPAANLVMALLGAALMWVLLPMARATLGAGDTGLFYYFYLWFLPQFTVINLYLLFFNLLPIPPLDGSSIFAILVPDRYLETYYNIERYAMPVFMVVAFVIPAVTGFNPFGAYLNATAGNLADFLLPL